MRVDVDDPADPRLWEYVGLTDLAARTAFEAPGGTGEGLFVAEGELVVRRAVAAGYRLRSALLSPHRHGALAGLLEPLAAPLHVGSKELLEAVTGFHVHRGVLAAFDRRPLPSAASLLEVSPRVAVLEDVNNHTNLGAVFRCAAALGVDAVLLDPRTVDPLYRRSVRVSMGEVLAVPYARLPAGTEGLALLRASGHRVAALTPDASAEPLDQVVVAPEERLALVLGAEGPGLSAGVLEGADLRVRIPMSRGVDSLNVAAAAAVAFWVLARR